MGKGTRLRIGLLALTAALVTGLGAAWGWNAAPTEAGTSPRPVTFGSGGPAVVADRPSAGCGTDTAVRPGSTAELSLPSGGFERTYLLHLPSSYDADQALPLVVAFHGRGNSGRIMEAQSGLSNLPAVVAYPDGVLSQPIGKRAWSNAPYAAQGVDDVAFTRALLDAIETSVCVDLDRVYSVGHSNGGGFAVQAGCELRRDFAAVAVVSAALYGTSVGCEHPMSVFELHGTDDTIIPYAGVDEPALQLPGIGSWVREQAAVDGCDTEPSARVLGIFVTRFTFDRCASGRTVVHLRVSGGGHAWRRELIGGYPLYAHIWNFLRTQSLDGRAGDGRQA